MHIYLIPFFRVHFIFVLLYVCIIIAAAALSLPFQIRLSNNIIIVGVLYVLCLDFSFCLFKGIKGDEKGERERKRESLYDRMFDLELDSLRI